MRITDVEKQIVTDAEDALAAVGNENVARLWIQRGVGLIVATSCQQHKVEQLQEARDFIQDMLDQARPH